MIYALIILDVLAVLWMFQVLREFPRTNSEILDLQSRSRDLTLIERTILEHKIKTAQHNFDASAMFFAVAVILNCMFGLYKLGSWIIS